MGNRIDDDLYVGGILSAGSMQIPNGSVVDASLASGAEVQRDKLKKEVLLYPVPWNTFRVWDAFESLLPGTPASDDLGLVGGTHGTNTPQINSHDLKTLGATSVKARFAFQLPPEYDGGEAVSIRTRAAMSAVADASATIDFDVRKSDSEGGISGSDLVTTAATSINSVTFANYEFALTATTLNPGDVLDVLVTAAVNDAAGGSPVTVLLGLIGMLLSVRG